MAFERSILTIKTTATAAAAAAAVYSFYYSSFPNSSTLIRVSKNLSYGSLSFSLNPNYRLEEPCPVKSFGHPPSAAVEMDHNQRSENGAVVPAQMTEFVVDMSCEGCVKSVKAQLQTVDGVKNIDVDLTNQVVRVLSTSPVKLLTEALEQTGRKARLIGQGTPEAAVAEFKGPVIFGVVRLAQVNMELAKIEATFGGLAPGKHGWSINQFGDLTMGAASTGKVFNQPNYDKEPLGDLGTLNVDDKGEAFFSGVKEKLRVTDLIGRSIVVYETEGRSNDGLAAAVVARSAGAGENYKKLCSCDGTTIWEATSADFVPSKV